MVAKHGKVQGMMKRCSPPKLPARQALPPSYESPMLRSAIALAAANTWLSGRPLPEGAGKKGIVYALDIAALDLWGCELAVLSACQTGLGDIRMGEGVFGMRRAFAIAGTQTLIMSLWSVPARATALLMERFFHNLRQRRGAGRRLAGSPELFANCHRGGVGKDGVREGCIRGVGVEPSVKAAFGRTSTISTSLFLGRVGVSGRHEGF